MNANDEVNPVLRLNLIGGLANKMIEYIFAVSLKSRVPTLEIANVDIAEWNIYHPDVERREPSLILPDCMRVDLNKLSHEITNRNLKWISYGWYAQHMSNFTDNKEEINSLFKFRGEKGYESDVLVINIRGDEILDARHPGYVLVPISFYKEIVERTGLDPVFMGQIGANAYVEELKRAFPLAKFVPSQGAVGDFNVLRRSRHIIPAISTFSWLAAWLSEAQVHFPVLGLFNPCQERDHFLLPLEDKRYRFYSFPAVFSVPVDQVGKTNASIEGRWEAISSETLRWRIETQLRAKASKIDHAYAFDAEFYSNIYPDIKNTFGDDNHECLRHFVQRGFDEGRVGFAFDERKYLLKYIDAACSVGRGEYVAAIDHYILVGRKFGYSAI